MASGTTSYPGAPDVFTVPSDPEDTPLSSAGDGTRNLTESVGDQGAAVMALQGLAAIKAHTHSGGADGTEILPQSSTHANADTDTSQSSIHHTIGSGATQAAAGNHTHGYGQITAAPFHVVTSLTRPTSPNVGDVIVETDTLIWRQWGKFGTPSPVWQILPIGNVPVFRAEVQATQQVLPNDPHICAFTTVIEDFFASAFGIERFMVIDTSATDISIPEPGEYHVHASICWDPSRTYQDQSSVQVLVNGVDIGRKNWEWVRGPISPYAGTAGFSQTNEIDFYWRFQAGDVIRIVAQHNANQSSFLWFNNISGTHQVSYCEVVFHSV